MLEKIAANNKYQKAEKYIHRAAFYRDHWKAGRKMTFFCRTKREKD